MSVGVVGQAVGLFAVTNDDGDDRVEANGVPGIVGVAAVTFANGSRRGR
ncbi:hypothetical protein [Actinoplanes sichuanensis]|uniref:Uncharacterized protein n=1 Tax=Actinoplanes sichuanensis TaxID=512349 RepID=A0ABW4ARJ5_9ACTN|nr:hypothetical protein [Actinoplanes sichuanensis]